MLRNILAAIVGVVVAILTVMLVQMLGHWAYPPPADLNPEDADAMTNYVRTLPIGAFMFVLLSYVAAAFDGTFVACLIGRAKPFIYALVVGGLVLIATLGNLISIDHPTWFSISAVAGIVVAAWLASRIAPTGLSATEKPE